MILDRLFEEDNINLEKTLNIALAMEKAFKGANDIMGRGINSMQTFKKHMDKKSNFTKNRQKRLYCSRYTGTNHAKENCRFISSKCNFCGKIGHIKQACFASKKANVKLVKQKQVTLLDEVEDKNRIPLYELKIQDCILHEEEPKQPPIMINLKIENKSCSMELDTGGVVSVMSIGNFRKISNRQIKPTNIVFKTYKGDSLIPLGYVTVRVQYKNQKVNLNVYIVKENLDTILGREWLYKIHLDWLAIKAFRAKTEQNLNNLLREYKDIFDDKLGEISNYETKLKLRPRVRPFAIKGRVEKEIDRLEREGIIEKVDSSEWATPVVPVVKTDGSIRLCADYSVTLNPNLIVPQHPLPRLEEIFGSLNGEKQFTKLDFRHAYLQMKVRPDSQKLMTIKTHKGLYVCKRFMYGLNGAPAIWHRYVDRLFQGMDGVQVFMDDARITGSDEISHFTAVEEFFKKCRDHGLKLNLNKNFLSRLPKTSEKLEVKDDITIFQMSQIEALPVTSNELRQETGKDRELDPLLKALREGKDLQGRETQYTIEYGCTMYGQRVCIPRKFRNNVLKKLHAGHLGIVKMKAIARSLVYWKNVDIDIEEAAKNCVDCARYKADFPPKI
ncbi:uncharacterized protein K02A2.6 [Trichonephila clavipes]|nr:uncharacterized protein K02A2.6 [Trichonephila clavipes]